MRLENKVVIVTGAASGIGKETALAFHNEKCKVIAIDKNEKLMIDSDKFDCRIFDLSDLKKLPFFLNQLDLDYPKINALINVAGISPRFDDPYHIKSFERIFQVNFYSPLEISKWVSKKMIKDNVEGSIVNITTLAAHLAFPTTPAYQAAKAALSQLTRSMSLDLAEYKIRVNSIAPGYVLTSMSKKYLEDPLTNHKILDRVILKRFGLPEDVANTCLFLASDLSSYITGSEIYVDGGHHVKG